MCIFFEKPLWCRHHSTFYKQILLTNSAKGGQETFIQYLHIPAPNTDLVNLTGGGGGGGGVEEGGERGIRMYNTRTTGKQESSRCLAARGITTLSI